MQSGSRVSHLLVCSFISALGFAQPATVAEPFAPTAQPTALGERLASIAKESTVKCELGVYVSETTSGKVIASIQGEKFMTPASCNKLLTTAAGLSGFGPDYKFKTSIYADGEISNGTLNGDLIVYGTGDPTIGARFQKDKTDVTFFFRQWAGKLKEKGITKITGSVIADDSFFDDDYLHKDWYPNERAEWYSAEVSAVSFNDNCIDLTWDSNGAMPGDTLTTYTMSPTTTYGKITPAIRTVATGRPWEILYRRPQGSNDILVTGTLVINNKKNDSTAITDPALYTATVLHETLTSEGLSVTGKPRKVRQLVAEKKPKLLFEHESQPMTDVINIINRNSQNFYAECVLKALGKKDSNKGTYVDGCLAVNKWLKKAGAYEDGHAMVDGSGMAGENQVSPRMLTKVIHAMDQGEHRETYRTSLPVGGVSGSIKARFRDNAEIATMGKRILAKTGGIGGVRTLSGIVTDNSGTEYYFSVMTNRLRDHDGGTKLIDKLVLEIAKNRLN